MATRDRSEKEKKQKATGAENSFRQNLKKKKNQDPGDLPFKKNLTKKKKKKKTERKKRKEETKK